jgi:hypothetical protein
MSMKEDLLEIVAHWTHDINDYLADTSIPVENHSHDIRTKLVSLKVELAENLDSNY